MTLRLLGLKYYRIHWLQATALKRLAEEEQGQPQGHGWASTIRIRLAGEPWELTGGRTLLNTVTINPEG